MKKTIIAIFLVLLAIAALPIVVYSEESMIKDNAGTSKGQDSVRISDEIKAQLGVLEKSDLQSVANVETVMRIYNVSIHFAFSECNNIEEILASGELLSVYYAIAYTDNTIISKDEKGNMATHDVKFNTKAITAFKNDQLMKKVSPDIEVRNVYYLSGETSMNGTAIYYVTNLGDYVYYSYYGIGEGEYLFPIQDFCDYQKALLAEIAKHADEDGGVELKGVWDLSKYDINSSSFDLHVEAPTASNSRKIKWLTGTAIGVGLLAAGIVFGKVYSRRKKT